MILDGRALAAKVEREIGEEIRKKKIGKLAILMIGDNPVSEKYVGIKQRQATELGIEIEIMRVNKGERQERILEIIEKWNANSSVAGIMVQLPLPEGYDKAQILDHVDVSKDVDGLTATNLGRVFQGQGVAPAAVEGVMRLLSEYKIELEGKRVVVVNNSPLIGLPLLGRLNSAHATVTLVHEWSKDLEQLTLQADVLITGIGKSRIIGPEMIKEGAVVIDIGTAIENSSGRLVGDVDFERVSPKCSYITPVPGGVGPMTVAMLFSNLVKIAHDQNSAI